MGFALFFTGAPLCYPGFEFTLSIATSSGLLWELLGSCTMVAISRRESGTPLHQTVLGKGAEKKLRSYLLQESLLIIRKERTGCKRLDTTGGYSTHKERTENTWREMEYHAERGNASRGLRYRVCQGKVVTPIQGVVSQSWLTAAGYITR